MRQTYFAKLHPALCFGFFAAVLCLTVVVQHPAYLAVSLLAGVCLNVSLSGLRALRGLFPCGRCWRESILF